MRDAIIYIEAVSHYCSRSAQMGPSSELEHTRFDTPPNFDGEPDPEITTACAVCPLKKELKSRGKGDVDRTFGQEPLCNTDSRIR
jgi:hypothetical protein